MPEYSVYALCCPGDTMGDNVRYIGIASDTKARFLSHCCLLSNPATPKDIWTNQLAKQGERPVFKVLQSGDKQTCYAAERWWINALISEGHDLLNVTKRGKPKTRGNVGGDLYNSWLPTIAFVDREEKRP